MISNDPDAPELTEHHTQVELIDDQGCGIEYHATVELKFMGGIRGGTPFFEAPEIEGIHEVAMYDSDTHPDYGWPIDTAAHGQRVEGYWITRFSKLLDCEAVERACANEVLSWM